jgi:two-component system response regulator FixJ
MAVVKDIRKPIVFVLDDDDSVRRSLGRLIRAEGYEARLYGSPERFLDEVTASTVGCLVLDIAMPRVGGLDVQARLNERGIRLPVIVVTARDDDATRRDAKRCGAKFFFRKPVDERTLIDAIDWAANSEGERSAP